MTRVANHERILENEVLALWLGPLVSTLPLIPYTAFKPVSTDRVDSICSFMVVAGFGMPVGRSGGPVRRLSEQSADTVERLFILFRLPAADYQFDAVRFDANLVVAGMESSLVSPPLPLMSKALKKTAKITGSAERSL